jgi:glucokinase
LEGHSELVIDACCIAICGPIENETRMFGPVLPEQGPSGWGADIEKNVLLPLGKVIKKAVLINDCVAAGFGLTDLDSKDIVVLHHESGDKFF